MRILEKEKKARQKTNEAGTLLNVVWLKKSRGFLLIFGLLYITEAVNK